MLEKGKHGLLNVTRQSPRRIYAGLGWDPNEKAGILDKARAIAGGKKTWYDLDLSCFLFDAKGNLLESVTGDPARVTDASGHVYHSGDNVEGHGEGDDEQISVELENLPESIHHIIFTASIETGHTFAEIPSAEIRLADGYSDHDFLATALGRADDSAKSLFIFAHIYRSGKDWNLHNINEFLEPQDLPGWPVSLKKYLKI